ncbi:hypothetical protein BGZ46_001423 [Entomortierella lignicola]|nr:hypothetical protein BGZ46_001423 [Entomortierella lignicola]
MSIHKRPLARSSLLALLAFVTLSVLSTSSSASPTPHKLYNAAAIDIEKRSPEDSSSGRNIAGTSDTLLRAPHTPYGPHQTPGGGGLQTGGSSNYNNNKGGLVKRSVFSFFGQKEEPSNGDNDNIDKNNLDSDKVSFVYNKEAPQERDYWEKLRMEAEDMDYDIDEDDHVIIEPLFYSHDLFDDENDEDTFGIGEGIVDENSDDDEDQYDFDRPWRNPRYQNQNGPQNSADVDSGNKAWLLGGLEEDLEDPDGMMDELMDWVQDLDHHHSRFGESNIHDQGDNNHNNANNAKNNKNLKPNSLRRLLSKSWVL